MKLTSPAFRNGDTVPLQFTGEGEDVSPPLQWSHLPEATKEIAIVCEDPDAPRAPGPGQQPDQVHPFVHWLIYNISPSTSKLPLGLAQRDSITVPVIAHQGLNSFGMIGWNGPMPPINHGPHRYVFRLYALDAESQIHPGVSIQDFERAIEGHVLATVELTGVYERASVGLTRGALDIPADQPESRLH